jgi:hypothetical protein
MPQLNDIYGGVGLRQHLSFARRRDGQQDVVVGRFIATLKMVGDYMTKYEFFDGKNLTGPKKAQSQVHMMPPEEPNFKWRVRVDLRCALDVPIPPPGGGLPEGTMPSTYAEIGWSLYENAEPDEFNKVLSVMCEDTQSPHWN